MNESGVILLGMGSLILIVFGIYVYLDYSQPIEHETDVGVIVQYIHSGGRYIIISDTNERYIAINKTEKIITIGDIVLVEISRNEALVDHIIEIIEYKEPPH